MYALNSKISTTALTLKKTWIEASKIDPHPLPLAMLKENEAILKTRSDVVKKEKRQNRKWLDSCFGTERNY